MDDPWANAWGDPTNPPATSSWSSHTEEADIGLPAWATATGAQWVETGAPDTTLWNDPATPAPQASIYDSIPLGKAPAPVSDLECHNSPPNHQVDSVPTSPQLNSASPPPVSSPSPTDDSSLTPQREPSLIPPSPPQIPGSPDPFGSFETGLNEIEDEPWSSTAPSFPVESVDAKAWGTPWGSTRSDAEEDERDDEWEAAKRQKEKQDRQVVSIIFVTRMHPSDSFHTSRLSFCLPSSDSSRSYPRTCGLNREVIILTRSKMIGTIGAVVWKPSRVCECTSGHIEHITIMY